MESAEIMYTVYVKTDDQHNIIDVTSSAFLTSTDGWIAIDSGYGDRYLFAQSKYFPSGIRDERGICRYKLIGGVEVEKTQEEMDAEWEESIGPSSNIESRIDNVEMKTAELEETIDMLLSGVTEDE